MRRLIDTKPQGSLLNVKPTSNRFIDVKPVIGQFDKQRLDDIVTNLHRGMPMGPGWYMYVTYPENIVVNP